MADGGSDVERAAALSAAQTREANEGARIENPDIEAGKPSPLELPPRSYTTETAEGAGGPSTLEEIESQRARQLQMAKTGEQLVGASVVPTVGAQPTAGGPAQPEAAAAPGRAGKPATGAEAEEEVAAAATEADIAQALERERQRQARAQEEAAAGPARVGRIQQVASRAFFNAAKRGGYSMIEYLIGFFILAIITDLQLLNHWIFKKKFLPPPNLSDYLALIIGNFGSMMVVLIVLFIYEIAVSGASSITNLIQLAISLI
jgi:hypothetical protein